MDPAKFSRWFEDLTPGLSLYARQWLDADSAPDAVQAAFLRLLGQPVEPRNVKAWLYRTVRHAALDVRRSERRRVEREKQAASPGAGAGTYPEDLFEAQPDVLINAQAATAALTHLTVEQREVVVLRIWGGLSWPEIAELIGAPTSTVFSRYKAALAAIRARLEHPCKTNH